MELAIYLFEQHLIKIEPSRIKFMLDNNISFVSYFKEKLPSKLAVKSAIKMFKIDKKKINVELILTCLKNSNYPAYNLVLTHEKGTEWLQQTITELKDMYF